MSFRYSQLLGRRQAAILNEFLLRPWVKATIFAAAFLCFWLMGLKTAHAWLS